MTITLRDIAEKAGLSISTVSRVLNRKTEQHRISKETERLVLKTAKELNYRPNQLARGLRLRNTQTIGLVVPDISNPFFACLTRSIQNTAHKLGYTLIVCDTDENVGLEIEHINLLRSKGVDGFVIMPVGQRYEHLEPLVGEGVPVVLVDRCFPELQTDSVVVDNHRGAYELTEYLLACGHRRIAIIQGLPQTFTSNERVRGYRDALLSHGVAVDESLIVGRDFRRENGYIETKLLLSLREPPSAIFATSDLITLGALEAISEEGLHIPDDISLVSFDDVEFGPFLRCPLTAIAQPKEIMGEIAVNLLMERLRGRRQGEAQRIVLPPRLVIRQSVKPVGAGVSVGAEEM